MNDALWPFTLSAPHPDGDRVVLRPLRRADKSEWEKLGARNRDWIGPWESHPPVPGRPLRFGQLVRHDTRSARAGVMQPFVIERRGRITGRITLGGITWGAQRSGTAGYWVAREHAGRGLAPLALAVLVDHAFGTLGLHRVEANIRPENTASLRVVEKLGFRDEGVRERLLHVDGQWRDHRIFAVVTEDLAGGSMFKRWSLLGKHQSREHARDVRGLRGEQGRPGAFGQQTTRM